MKNRRNKKLFYENFLSLKLRKGNILSSSNKKGFELIWSNVVLMILGFVVLIALIMFFTGVTKGFWDGIKGYFSYSNVDHVIQSCNVLVDSSSSYTYCCEKNEVKYYNNGTKAEGRFSCGNLSSMDIGKGIRKMDCSEVSCG